MIAAESFTTYFNNIEDLAKQNLSISPKEVQKGTGMGYRPMQVSLAAATYHIVNTTYLHCF